MIILHIAPIGSGRLAGPTVSVPSLIHSLNQCSGVQSALVNSLTRAQGTIADWPFPVFDCRELLAAAQTLGLPAPFNRPDLVVFHSTYVPVHARIARKLTRLRIPYIVCPRGGLTRFAGANKRWKKRIGNLLFFGRMVGQARAVHCLTPREAAESRHWKRPTFVVGNGIQAPPQVHGAARPATGARRIVFIGRLAIEHKGLDLLLYAAALAAEDLRQRPGRVELYGPDCQGGADYLRGRIRRLSLADVVALDGPVSGRSKHAVLEQADVFVHTSRWEGHPMAVLEALAYGVPCLVTPGTNMSDDIVTAQAGWAVGETPDAIAGGLGKVLGASRGRLERARANAAALATRRYRWSTVADQTLEAYRKYAA